MCMAFNMACVTIKMGGFCSGRSRFFVNTAREKSRGARFYTVAVSSLETVCSCSLSLRRATVILSSSLGKNRNCRARLD